MIASRQTLRKIRPVEPFCERTIEFGVSYGVGPAGYDVRCDQFIRIRPGQFMLASTMERFTMPGNLLGKVHDKSTWARRGLAVQNTVIEPGWTGYLTIELTNAGEDTLVFDRGTAIAQIIFHFMDHPTDQPYDGKYQDQERGPQQAILEKPLKKETLALDPELPRPKSKVLARNTKE